MQRMNMDTDGWSKEQIIEFKKLLGNQIKSAAGKSRHERCLLCGNAGGFCNSHTIPQFSLENIAWNGKLNSFNTLIDSDLLKKDSGINNAATFHIICRSCDSKVFQDYESEVAYESTPSEGALNQIVLKTSLRDIYKHEMEIEMYEASKQIIRDKNPMLALFLSVLIDAQIAARSRDVAECYEVFNKAKASLENPNSWLRIISYDKLDYTAPLAFQGMVALITGVDGEVINNIFNHKQDYKIEYLHLAIFPLKKSTAVITFLDSENTRYSQLETFLTESTLERRLEVISRIIMLYSEDYFLSKQLSEDTIMALEDSAKTLQDAITLNPKKSMKNAVKDYDLRRDICIPNLLLKEHAISTED